MKNKQVHASGAMVLAAMADFARQLEEALAGPETDAVTIDCAGLTECDLSFVQAVVAGRRLAHRTGRQIALSGPAPRPLADLLERAGWPLDHPQEAGFWLGRECAA